MLCACRLRVPETPDTPFLGPRVPQPQAGSQELGLLKGFVKTSHHPAQFHRCSLVQAEFKAAGHLESQIPPLPGQQNGHFFRNRHVFRARLDTHRGHKPRGCDSRPHSTKTKKRPQSEGDPPRTISIHQTKLPRGQRALFSQECNMRTRKPRTIPIRRPLEPIVYAQPS